MATVATMIMMPLDHRCIAAATTVTMDPGPPITVAIVATVAGAIKSAIISFGKQGELLSFLQNQLAHLAGVQIGQAGQMVPHSPQTDRFRKNGSGQFRLLGQHPQTPLIADIDFCGCAISGKSLVFLLLENGGLLCYNKLLNYILSQKERS